MYVTSGGLCFQKKFLVQVGEWAAEVAEALRLAVGAEGLAAGMNTARQAVQEAKAKRRRNLALQAVVDPEAAAQRRIKRNAKKADDRKRKRAHERVMREAGAGAGGRGAKRGRPDRAGRA